MKKEVNISNKVYKKKGIALIQKISTPWTVIRKGEQIVSAFPERESTLDFRGTVFLEYQLVLIAKETTEEKGLPLANHSRSSIDYMRQSIINGRSIFLYYAI